MASKQLNLRLSKPLSKELNLISKILHIPQTEWARNVLAHEIKKELEEHRAYITEEYLKGNISKEELEEYFGKKKVKEILLVIEKLKESIDFGDQLAKK